MNEPVPIELRAAIDELRELAAEAIPYAGKYFDEKWALTERFNAAYPIVDAWLESFKEGGNADQNAPRQ